MADRVGVDVIETKWFPETALDDGSLATYGRTCRVCGAWKPATEYEHAPRPGGRVYLKTYCRTCRRSDGGRPAPVVRELICANPECGQPFTTTTWRAEHCSNRCKKTSMRRRRGQLPYPDRSVIPDKRECRKCGETKPASEFYLRQGVGGMFVLMSRCKDCMRATDRARRPKKSGPTPCAWCGGEFTPRNSAGLYCSRSCRGAAMRDRSKRVHSRPAPVDDGMKTCRTCGERKPVADFWTNGAGGRRAHCGQCYRDGVVAKNREAARAALGLPPGAPLPSGRLSRPDGHTWTDPHGYVHEKRAAHPRADGRGYVGQHILAFEDHYDVKVPRGYTVHHRDDDRSNNDWRNLELRVGQHGKHGNVVPTLLRHDEYLIETLEVIVNKPEYLARNIGMLRDLGFTVLSPSATEGTHL